MEQKNSIRCQTFSHPLAAEQLPGLLSFSSGGGFSQPPEPGDRDRDDPIGLKIESQSLTFGPSGAFCGD